ncbi:MAG: hypothetical protein RMK29_00955 [Myxococcales bacterium]|nr:hypothetical protein [Myxococcota bacterium]MDW8280247.1 hypothetical protein [Myxococcales bacterium]
MTCLRLGRSSGSLLGALLACLLALPARAQEKPDLSLLPEVDDVTPPAPDPPPQVLLPSPPPMAMPYLGQMLLEPEIDFVPSRPTTDISPRAVWEGMMVPPPPSPAEMVARRLRHSGIGLLTAGTVLALIAVPSLAARHDSPVAWGLGYTALGAAAMSFAAGGTLFGIGDQRLRTARRNAAGLALAPGTHGLSLLW